VKVKGERMKKAKKQKKVYPAAELLQRSFDYADFLRELQKLARPVLFSRKEKNEKYK
jgi:hypothetical protein